MAKNKALENALALYPEHPNSVTFAQEILWVDGKPTLTRSPVRLSPEPAVNLKELLRLSLDLPYSGPDDSLKGLSLGEAMILSMAKQAANGDSTARKEILDRFMGQTTQKNINLSGDLNQFLDHVAQATRETVIDVEMAVTGSESPDVEDL
jgi:hypothetical protein